MLRGLFEKNPPTACRSEPIQRPFGVTLAGYRSSASPNSQAAREGWAVGALATICVDNPMAAATGRGSATLPKSALQKQDPVDIPQSETRAEGRSRCLGASIHSLLTR